MKVLAMSVFNISFEKVNNNTNPEIESFTEELTTRYSSFLHLNQTLINDIKLSLEQKLKPFVEKSTGSVKEWCLNYTQDHHNGTTLNFYIDVK